MPLPIFSCEKESTGYCALTQRVPEIMTKVIDYMNRCAYNLLKENREEEKEDLLKVISLIGDLRRNLQNVGEMKMLENTYKDYLLWNKALNTALLKSKTNPVNWLNTSFLLAECYYYRSLFECFQKSQKHKDFDFFREIKEASFTNALDSLIFMSTETLEAIDILPSVDAFISSLPLFICFSLSQNQLDLSLTAGNQIQSHDISTISKNTYESIKETLVVDDMEKFLAYMGSLAKKPTSGVVHIVTDNAGGEFFADLCLGLFLLSSKTTESIVYHVKEFPWLVLDVTLEDVSFFRNQLKNSSNESMKKISDLLEKSIDSGFMKFVTHPIWTTPLHFTVIPNEESFDTKKIYEEFLKSNLVIFKGDLNYRRLTGEYDLPFTTSFEDTLGDLRGFPLLSLRTLKSDSLYGVSEETLNRIKTFPSNWMQMGKYGLISFVDK